MSEYHEDCDMGDDGGPCEHCLEMRRLRSRVTELEEALRQIEHMTYSVMGDAESDLQNAKEIARAALAAAGEGEAT
jgi:hypothetical protein